YHQHRARPCRQGHAAFCRTRSSDGRSQSCAGLSVAPISLFAEFVPLGQSYDPPDELRLLLRLPAASQDGCRSYWCSLCDLALRYLDAPAIPANLLRTGFDAIWRARFGISHARLGNGMLFFSRAITDALESA